MDGQDREDDITQQVRERLLGMPLRYDNRLNTDKAVHRLNEQFSLLSRRRKGSIQQQLDRDQLSRRDFLRLLGIGAGTAAVLGFLPALKQGLGIRPDPTGHASASSNVSFSGNVNVSQGDGYEIWEIPSGNFPRAVLSDGSVVENVLIDQTAENSGFDIAATGVSDWTIRNVGWKGIADDPNPSNPKESRFMIHAHTPSGGSGLVENIYARGWGTWWGGGRTGEHHGGHLDVRHTNIAGFGNNAWYADTMARTGRVAAAMGTAAFENCYHRDCTSTTFRIGADGSYVKNSVSIVNDPEGKRGTYPGNTSTRNARNAWVRNCPVRFEKVAFYVSPNDVQPDGNHIELRHIGSGNSAPSVCDRTVLELVDCDMNPDAPNNRIGLSPIDGATRSQTVVNGSLGDSPTLSVLGGGGVPTSPEEAARGERGTPAAPDEVPGEPRRGANTETGQSSDIC